jgi:ankyrin repeat protein
MPRNIARQNDDYTNMITLEHVPPNRRYNHDKGRYDVHSLAEYIEHAKLRDPDFGVRRPRWPHTRKNMTNQEIDAVMLKARETGRLSLSNKIRLGHELMNAVKRDNKTAVKNILNRHPNAAKHADNRGRLPLHHVKSGPVAERLLEAFENAAKHADEFGRMPLHFAGQHGNPNAVRAMLNANRTAAKHADQYGMLPLHYAAQFDKPDVVRAILNANRTAAKRVDKYGRLPLHVAVQFGNLNAARAILNANPNAANHADEFGRLPLGLARARGNPNIVRALQRRA